MLAARCSKSDAGESETIAQQAMDLFEKDSRNILTQYVAATAYERAGEHYEAAMVLRDLLEIIPNHKALYIDVCRNFRMSDRFKEVLKYAGVAENKSIKSPALLLEGGLAFEALGQRDKARRVFTALLDENPNQTEALLFFAREHNRKGEYKKGMKLADRIIALDNENGYGYFERAKALAMTGQKDAAIAALEKSVAFIPKEASVRRLLADLLFEDKAYENAARHYNQIISLNPKYYAGHIKTAEAWQNAGNIKEAAAVLARTERLFADSIDLQKRLGLLQNKLGNASNAALHLERYTKKGTPDAEVYMTLGDIYTASKKYDKAFYHYNHAMPLMKDKKPCRFALAKMHQCRYPAMHILPFPYKHSDSSRYNWGFKKITQTNNGIG